MTVLIALGAWVVLSVPVGLVVGHALQNLAAPAVSAPDSPSLLGESGVPPFRDVA